MPDGRLVFTMWGSAVRGDNWQCGVLLADDGGHTLRYRQVGCEPIRRSARTRR
ncbi:MAG: sialidase family protein [Spirochaetaceae bacterium]|nr:sialidase family protein [Spirochaetaceae bacterium]